MSRKKICPKCGSNDISMILYGLVNQVPTEEEMKKEKIRLGGCIVNSESPKWVCDDCSYEWGTVYD